MAQTNFAHGISQVAVYDPDAGPSDTAAVVYSTLDADLSSVQVGGNVEADRHDEWGNAALFPGGRAELIVEGWDPGETKLKALQAWYNDTPSKEVAACILGPGNAFIIHWEETVLLNEPRSTTIRASFAGRSDFSRFEMRAEGGDPKIYSPRVNFVSHLDPWNIDENTASGERGRRFYLPIADVNLYVSCKVEEVSGETFNAAAKVLSLEFLDVEGNRIGSAVTATYSEGRVELTGITPAMVHEVRVRADRPNDTFTVSELSVRGDGSYVYENN